jgi:FMN phosphatase YigB (HAD superfamily)
VDVTIDGSLTGVLKPDPRAYELALEALDLPLPTSSSSTTSRSTSAVR